MARKTDFTKNTKNTIDVMRTIATSNTADTKDTRDTKNEYRFNTRFTSEQWKYLQEKKWTTRRSITAILQELVTEDMERHPEIVKTIDELNG